MSGLAVLGGSGFARALASRENAALLDVEARPGPWLGRRVDADTGEGIRAALAHAERLVVVLDHPSELHGLFLVLRPGEFDLPVVVVRPTGTALPAGVARFPSWAALELGWPWGVGDPVHDTWVSRVGRGEWLEAPDPGPIPVVPLAEAIAVAMALLERPGARGRWPGVSTVLPELAERIGPGKVRRGWMTARWARAHGVSTDAVEAWTHRPAGPADLPPEVLVAAASRR